MVVRILRRHCRLLRGRRPAVLATAWMLMATMGHVLHNQLCVFLSRHSGEFFEKSDSGPDLLVGMVCPGWHPGHLDAVFDNPEHFGVGEMDARMRQVGRCGVETFA